MKKKTGSHGDEFTNSSRGTVGNGVFSAVCAEIL
jgi:hypothetical protein